LYVGFVEINGMFEFNTVYLLYLGNSYHLARTVARRPARKLPLKISDDLAARLVLGLNFKSSS
jgi:hypothetical protein